MPSVWCALRSFADHAAELGNAEPAEPRFFLKPWGALARPPLGCEVELPDGVHHEVELVLEIREGLHRLGIGLDLTKRDLQSELKSEGLPWTEAKGFANSALIGELVEPPVGLAAMRIELAVDGGPRQEAAISEMSFPPLDLLEALSNWAPLEDGDLLFCGTPAGVAPIRTGEEVHARLLREDGWVLSELRFTAARPRAD